MRMILRWVNQRKDFQNTKINLNRIMFAPYGKRSIKAMFEAHEKVYPFLNMPRILTDFFLNVWIAIEKFESFQTSYHALVKIVNLNNSNKFFLEKSLRHNLIDFFLI